jgi:hypothetical protein
MADDLLYRDTIAFNTGDCTGIAGTSEAILWTQANVPTALPAGYWTPRHLPRGGKLLKLTCAGKVTSAASSPGNLTLTLRYGVTTGGTSLAAGAANALATKQVEHRVVGGGVHAVHRAGRVGDDPRVGPVRFRPGRCVVHDGGEQPVGVPGHVTGRGRHG